MRRLSSGAFRRAAIATSVAAPMAGAARGSLTLEYDSIADTISITSTAAGVIVWMISTAETATSSEIIAGTGAVDSGTINTFPGTIGKDIDTSGLPAADYYFHAVLTSDGSSVISDPASEALFADEWYAPDALYAWNPATDTDTASVNPDIGDPMPRTSGGPATYQTTYWSLNNAFHDIANALSVGIDFSKPLMIAYTLEDVGFSGRVAQIGFGSAMIEVAGGWDNNLNWLFYDPPIEVVVASVWPSTGFHVLWVYWDPATETATAGHNQITDASGAVTGLAAQPVTNRGLSLNLDSQPGNIGMVQMVNRTGMTLADAKALVQTMQDAQGIA